MSEAMGSGEVPPHIANEILDQLEQAMKQAPKRAMPKTDSSPKVPTTTTVSPSDQSMPDQQISTNHSAPSRSEYISAPSEYSLVAEADRYAAVLMPPVEPREISDPMLGVGSIPHLATVHLPPFELIPYMAHAQHNSRTFAGRLFWSTMSFGYQLVCCEDWNTPSLAKMFQYYKHHLSQDTVKRRIAIKLVTNGTGMIHEDTTPEITSYVNKLVVKNMTESGEQVQNYLDPREVELYFRRRWIDPNNLSLADTSDAYSTLSTDKLTKMLVNELTLMAVCFGDGPRFHIDDVEKVYQAVAGKVQMLPDEIPLSTTGVLDYISAF